MPSWLKNFLARFRPYAPHIDPPVTHCPDRAQAWIAAVSAAKAADPINVCVLLTTGTPSMIPLIPATPTWIAYKPIPFSEIRVGIVAIYKAAWQNNELFCHRLVARGDDTGYIPSGDNNRYSENLAYVRAENFLGEVVGIFTFPAFASANAA